MTNIFFVTTYIGFSTKISIIHNRIKSYIHTTITIWNTTNIQWQLDNTTWDDSVVATDQISADRAIISGSDVTPITEYLSPNENARYKVYLG